VQFLISLFPLEIDTQFGTQCEKDGSAFKANQPQEQKVNEDQKERRLS